MPAGNVIPVITIGADPETFVLDKKSGKIVSAHDLLPGTKENPHPVAGGAIQVDGLAAEFNTEPCATGSQFETNCEQVIGELRKALGGKYEVVFEPAHVFDQEYYDSLPDDPKILGCTADFNAYTQDINPPPDTMTAPTMRTTSGHIHVGWGSRFDPEDTNHIADCAAVAKQLDFALGIVSLLWDPDPRRRVMYGKAGCFRPKTYGMEYRTMSNVWLRPGLVTPNTVMMDGKRYKLGNSGGLPAWVADTAIRTVADLFRGIVYENGPWGRDAARNIIDNNVADWIYRPEFKRLRAATSLPGIKLPPDPNESKPKPDHFKTGVTVGDPITFSTEAGSVNPGIFLNRARRNDGS